ncbi:hypothetical protein SO802_013613 [Lithocarpus litseifolius]|uniref:Nodulin-like domain-containing protein n=1 Tax=Lithocarpus litseifolius TaxID=425828 RepID=A0AAW2D620_9ROSI
MANSFFNSPWTGLAACILLMAVSGTSSLFSTYANDLKKYSHFNQNTILIISWLKDIGENAGILAAYVAEMFSPRKLILLGSIGRLVSLMVLYATLKGLFPSIMWVQAMAVLLSAVAETTIKAASRTSSLRPFRKMAPMTVFILNGYADMSGMLLTVIFTSSTDMSSFSSSIKFLIFLSLFPFVITLISLPALCTDTVTVSGNKLWGFVILSGSTGLTLLFGSQFHSNVAVKSTASAAIILLMVPFFLSILIRKKDQPIVSQSDPSKFQKSVFKACFSVEFAAVALATCLGLGVTSSSIVVVGQVYESLSLKSNSVPYIVATACVATYCGRLFCWFSACSLIFIPTP